MNDALDHAVLAVQSAWHYWTRCHRLRAALERIAEQPSDAGDIARGALAADGPHAQAPGCPNCSTTGAAA